MEEDYVTVDWDDITPAFAKDRILRLLDEHNLGWQVKKVQYRRSANGGVHVLMRFYYEHTEVQRMRIRANMGDDPARWDWDVLRSVSSVAIDYTKGVIFDLKDGKKAGPWIHMQREWRRS